MGRVRQNLLILIANETGEEVLIIFSLYFLTYLFPCFLRSRRAFVDYLKVVDKVILRLIIICLKSAILGAWCKDLFQNFLINLAHHVHKLRQFELVFLTQTQLLHDFAHNCIDEWQN